MTALPSHWGTLKGVGATALVSCKREMFRYPALVFHWRWLPVKKAEPPRREVLTLVPRLPVPAAPLLARSQPLTLPKAGCSPPTTAIAPWAQPVDFGARAMPRGAPGRSWAAAVSPASSRASTGTCTAEGEKTASSLWLVLNARLLHRSPVRSLGSRRVRRGAQLHFNPSIPERAKGCLQH